MTDIKIYPVFNKYIYNYNDSDVDECGYILFNSDIKAYYEVYESDKDVEVIFKNTCADYIKSDILEYINYIFENYKISVYITDENLKYEENKNIQIIKSNDNLFRITLNGYYIGHGSLKNNIIKCNILKNIEISNKLLYEVLYLHYGINYSNVRVYSI